MAFSLRAPTMKAFETVAKMGAIDVTFLDRVTFSDRALRAAKVSVLFDDQQADSLLKVIRDTGESTRMRLELSHD